MPSLSSYLIFSVFIDLGFNYIFWYKCILEIDKIQGMVMKMERKFFHREKARKYLKKQAKQNKKVLFSVSKYKEKDH